MAAQRKTKSEPLILKRIEYHFQDKLNNSASTEGVEKLPEHPNGYDLHNYFSRFWSETLAADQRTRIGLHLALCTTCADIGKVIQADDEVLDQLLASPETPGDESDTERSINVFHAVLRNMMSKEPVENFERGLSVAESTESPLTALEMVQLVPDLAEAVTRREIPRALAIVDKTITRLETLPLLQPGAIHLLAYCAWAIDYYEPYFDQVKEAVARFKRIPRKELILSDLALLNIAEGLVKFHQEQYADAAKLFHEAQDDADRTEDPELMTVTRYYRGRVLARMRLYDQSLVFIRDAISRDLAARNHARVAAMELVEGWLLFLKGEIPSSQRVLDRASARLGSRSDAWVDLGNIRSFQGRLYREAGPDYYLKALDCFSEAIEAYRQPNANGGHRNVARAHINSAFVYRLLARDLGDEPANQKRRMELEPKIKDLRDKAFAEIEQARTIYKFAKTRHFSALSRLHSILALLHFDELGYEKAAAAAEEAYRYANEKGDNLGMANARIIQSKFALDGGLKGYVDAQDAFRLAREAVDYAKQTENRRVLARAYLFKGQAILELPGKDHVRAEQCLMKARKCLVPEDRDYLRNSLSRLEKLIEKVSQARQRPDAFVAYMTVERMRKDIAAGYSLAEINEFYEERVARFVCAEFCDGNISKAANLLKTGTRKVRRAVSFYTMTEAAMKELAEEGIDEGVLAKLSKLNGREVQGHARFMRLLRKTLDGKWTQSLETAILSAVYRSD